MQKVLQVSVEVSAHGVRRWGVELMCQTDARGIHCPVKAVREQVGGTFVQTEGVLPDKEREFRRKWATATPDRIARWLWATGAV